ncbi:Inorganic diphosphatase [Spironucleus salmonicida]|uniref:Inorganic diphosphatase n=1 Tax=Spironucleus salmonicida TaxID=348837 RepID=V6LS84_9EUKA|nr:Inorganic diphosphatase [Spironucleus salmonicida]|eukprot:EST47522.1 Inorganic diphosphatase [Spironucleus salmonicida]
MKSTTYSFAPTNTDAQCAATAHAYLQRQLNNEATSCTFHVTPQSQFIHDFYDIKIPEEINDVFPRARHILEESTVYLKDTDSVARVLEVCALYNKQFYPVLNSEEKVSGVIGIKDLFLALMNPREEKALTSVQTSILNINIALKGYQSRIAQDADKIKNYEIYTICSDFPSFLEAFSGFSDEDWKRGIFITSKNEDINFYIKQKPAGLLIITKNYEKPINLNLAEDAQIKVKGNIQRHLQDSVCDIIETEMTAQSAALLVKQSSPIILYLSKDQNAICSHLATLDDIKKRLLRYQNLPGVVVVDDNQRIKGTISRDQLARQSIIQIHLVGTNNMISSIDGIQSSGVEILSITDNHHLNQIETDRPLTIYCRNVSSTSTLVTEQFQEIGIVPPISIAGLLLGGILTGTRGLTKATVLDKKCCDYLSLILGKDWTELNTQIMHAVQFSLSKEVILSDCKSYACKDGKFKVSQIEIQDVQCLQSTFWEQVKDILGQVQGKDVFAGCFVTDMAREESMLVITGSQKYIDCITYKLYQGIDSVFDLGSVLSRKKQLIPTLQAMFD